MTKNYHIVPAYGLLKHFKLTVLIASTNVQGLQGSVYKQYLCETSVGPGTWLTAVDAFTCLMY